jgi:diguanylate cyclase (GGDEF)-like protein
MRIASSLDRLRILLIGEDTGHTRSAQLGLQAALPEAHSLEVCTTVAEALNLGYGESFDIVLLHQAPSDTGIAFPGLHRMQAEAPDLPVIFIAGSRNPQLGMNAVRAGAEDYLLSDELDSHRLRRAIQFAILNKQFDTVVIPRSNRDLLTGLVNRTLFESRVGMARARAKRTRRPFALLHLDLDGFGMINKALGTAGADDVLRQFSMRLRAAFPERHTIARFCGDDFFILAEGLSDVSEAEQLAQRVIDLMDVPFNYAGHEVEAQVSIGITTFSPGQETGWRELLQQADAAMHDAKLYPGNFFRSFAGLLSHLAAWSTMEEELILAE